MDTPTLVGTGFVVLGAVVWIVCAVYAYQNAPKFGRNAWFWTIICVIFGPLGLMLLYVLPKNEPAQGQRAHAQEGRRPARRPVRGPQEEALGRAAGRRCDPGRRVLRGQGRRAADLATTLPDP